MLTKRSLRLLIFVDMVLVVAGAVVGMIGEAWLPEPLRAFEQARAAAELETKDRILLGAAIPLVLAWLVASIGLMCFWRPARLLYLGCIVGSGVLMLIGGPYISTGLGEALDSISLTLSGFLLALIHFSPLQELYEKPQSRF
jgi:hypothetical protein